MSEDLSTTNREPEIITGLDETWSAFREIFGGLEEEGNEEDWSRPTPCTDWSVKDLAAHLGAIEGQFQGLPQPPTPEPGGSSIDDWTAAGVEARRDWMVDQVLEEVAEASKRQLEHLRGLGPVDAESWQAPVPGPVGETTEAMLADIRLMDLYIHLLDLRTALGRGLRLDAEPTACRLCTERAIDLAGWGGVKKAGIEDGRVRLELSGLGSAAESRTVDVVIEGGRGSLEEPEGDAAVEGDVITGPAPAFMLVAAGRLEMADEARGVVAAGATARRLLEGYRIFA